MSTAELEARVKELESELAAMRGESARSKIAAMSSEVVDSNPYSRLMALKRMGIVDNYEHIRECRDDVDHGARTDFVSTHYIRFWHALGCPWYQCAAYGPPSYVYGSFF